MKSSFLIKSCNYTAKWTFAILFLIDVPMKCVPKGLNPTLFCKSCDSQEELTDLRRLYKMTAPSALMI